MRYVKWVTLAAAIITFSAVQLYALDNGHKPLMKQGVQSKVYTPFSGNDVGVFASNGGEMDLGRRRRPKPKPKPKPDQMMKHGGMNQMMGMERIPDDEMDMGRRRRPKPKPKPKPDQ